MGKNEKLIARFNSMPKDFTYNELVSLLAIFDFIEYKVGKTSGSRVKFKNEKFSEQIIRFHKPHPNNIIKMYVLKQIKEVLVECGYLQKVDKLTEEN